MAEEKPCISLTDISVEHFGTIVCEHIDLQICPGGMTVFTGRNSEVWNILLRMIGGQQAIPAGQIDLWGVPVSQISRRSLNSLAVFVTRHQLPLFAYPVIDFVLQGCEPHLKPLQAPTETDREQARAILRMLKIEKLMYRDSSLLSNRERQLAVVARALMQDARLLLLDLPLDGLDDLDQQNLHAILRAMAHEQDKTVVLTIEDPTRAMTMADQLVIFDNHGVAAVLKSEQPDYRQQAIHVLTGLALVDTTGQLLDPSHFADAESARAAEQNDIKPGQQSSGKLF